MGKRACSTQALEAGIESLSLQDQTATELVHQNEEPPEVEDILEETGISRLPWYEELIKQAPKCEADCLDWKAWANCGAALWHLGEKKASWDCYKHAAHALQGFRTELTTEKLLADPVVGKFLSALDRDFRAGCWESDEAADLALFAVLVLRGRAAEVCTEIWHERLPNHYFAAMQALCRRLSTPSQPLRQVCPDDSRMDLMNGNTLALLVAPDGLFAGTDSKRARLHERACEFDAEAGPDCEQLLGRWHYDGMSYVISPLGDSACRFDEWAWAFLNRGIHHHGRLKLSDGWFQGELFNQEQCFVGCLRLRYDAQRQVLISQCRPQHGDWGPETTATSHSSELNQNDGSLTRYVVMATLLCTGGLASTLLLLPVLRSLDDAGFVLSQDLTWRSSMRPLFVAVGLEDVADDIERWTKDCWSTVPPGCLKEADSEPSANICTQHGNLAGGSFQEKSARAPAMPQESAKWPRVQIIKMSEVCSSSVSSSVSHSAKGTRMSVFMRCMQMQPPTQVGIIADVRMAVLKVRCNAGYDDESTRNRCLAPSGV
ncbi:unnamed protein product [Symbiodinium sp. CCMP2592]|nr:unnamed protein product [Symbiodinium sp. CCMP2592]